MGTKPAPPSFDPARLAALCRAMGVGPVELARRSGLAHANVSRYLSGRVTPGADKLAALLDAAGLKWADLDGE